jgi:hypothetical protein
MKYHEMIYGMAVVVHFLGESDDKPIHPAMLMDLVDIRFLRQNQLDDENLRAKKKI